MLVSLSISNFLLIDTLSLSFEQGLTTLTGETGAGKSILLDSLSLALGARGSATLVRNGADKATISAVFDLPLTDRLSALFEEQDLELHDDQIIIRRSIGADGKSRAFVNDQAVSISFLKNIGQELLEIHGQFDQHLLLETANHRLMLDAFAELDEIRADVRQTYQNWKEFQQKRENLEASLQSTQNQEDYLRHALAEFEALSPQEGEEAELAEKRTLLMNVEKLGQSLSTALHALDADGGAASTLATAQRELESCLSLIQEKAGPITDLLNQMAAECGEAISSLQGILEELEADPSELTRMEDRLYAIRDLARKHKVEADELPQKWQSLKEQLNNMESGEHNLDELRRQEQTARENFTVRATTLSERRKTKALKLDEAVKGELEPLKLEKADFVTRFELLPEDSWTEEGIDKIYFEARTNPGMPYGPIPKIASGGELSRFMLALKVVLAQTDPIPSMVFDEVDSGVGGATADAVGERLFRLSKDCQVLVVTHSPQVAARASQHFLVEKTDQNNQTVTTVRLLQNTEKQEEIARMLSGAQITDQAREAALSLMAG